MLFLLHAVPLTCCAPATAAPCLAVPAAHLPFSHHKLTPLMLRQRASSMPFTQLEVPAGDSEEEAAARPSFAFQHQAPLAAFSFPSGTRHSTPMAHVGLLHKPLAPWLAYTCSLTVGCV